MSYRAKDLKTGAWVRGSILQDGEYSYILQVVRNSNNRLSSMIDYISVDTYSVCKSTDMVYQDREIPDCCSKISNLGLIRFIV